MTTTTRHGNALLAATADDNDRITEGPGFVQPSSYLRQRGLSHPMTPASAVHPERPIDREERQGLVSSFFSSPVLPAPLPLCSCTGVSVIRLLRVGVVERDRVWLGGFFSFLFFFKAVDDGF